MKSILYNADYELNFKLKNFKQKLLLGWLVSHPMLKGGKNAVFIDSFVDTFEPSNDQFLHLLREVIR